MCNNIYTYIYIYIYNLAGKCNGPRQHQHEIDTVEHPAGAVERDVQLPQKGGGGGHVSQSLSHLPNGSLGKAPFARRASQIGHPQTPLMTVAEAIGTGLPAECSELGTPLPVVVAGGAAVDNDVASVSNISDGSG